HPPRQFGHRRVRLAVEAGEAARKRVLDPLDIESDNPAVALDDCAGWYQAIPRYVEIGDAPFPVHRFDFLRGHATSPSIHMSQGGSQGGLARNDKKAPGCANRMGRQPGVRTKITIVCKVKVALSQLHRSS